MMMIGNWWILVLDILLAFMFCTPPYAFLFDALLALLCAMGLMLV